MAQQNLIILAKTTKLNSNNSKSSIGRVSNKTGWVGKILTSTRASLCESFSFSTLDVKGLFVLYVRVLFTTDVHVNCIAGFVDDICSLRLAVMSLHKERC